jgi:hypothetical protein
MALRSSALIAAINVERRHLTATGKSNAAARLLPVYEEAARERMLAGKQAEPDPAANGREGTDEEEGKPREEKATGASERSAE